jgi:hypothetical protein
MMRAASIPVPILILATALAACRSAGEQPQDAAGPDAADGADGAQTWRSLFDGLSLAGWDRYLGEPAPGQDPLGLENDPQGVYSVVSVDGAPAIRISGEVWGALISRETFCDFHLRGQYKWGSLIGPSLGFRDSGLMYLSTGPLGAVNAGGPALSDPIGSGAYMVSVEYQISPTDVGAIAALGPIALTLLDRTVPAERADDWNDVDVVMSGGVVTHLLNGVEVARGQGFVLQWPGQPDAPLGCGKLQIESEGSEIFFRGLEIRTPP